MTFDLLCQERIICGHLREAVNRQYHNTKTVRLHEWTYWGSGKTYPGRPLLLETSPFKAIRWKTQRGVCPEDAASNTTISTTRPASIKTQEAIFNQIKKCSLEPPLYAQSGGSTYGGDGNPNHQGTEAPMRRGVCS
jgi:hypothetical protein